VSYADDERFFVKATEGKWSEVTAEQFKGAERAAGFHPKGGGSGFATGGFSGHGTRGMRIHKKWFAPGEHLRLSDTHPYLEVMRDIEEITTSLPDSVIADLRAWWKNDGEGSPPDDGDVDLLVRVCEALFQ
jgi:hypothetical protein